MIIPKQYDFSTVSGINENMIKQHYIIYEGYVNKLNEIWSLLNMNLELNKPNSTYSDIRSLKLGESYALNGIKLHELYFENITGCGKEQKGSIIQCINNNYGSFEEWLIRFKNIALSMRGWVVLAWEPVDCRLHIYGQDIHDKGLIWSSYPLLIIDVYEHAYALQFGINRKEYLDVIMNTVNWDIVDKRFIEAINKH
ncbi:MAG: superoxide dismutase [Eubacteriaceae bacterium]